MPDLSHLISHRFRGFSKIENSLEGLIAALDFGVLNLEFDIRVTKCGTPIIYHDEYAKDKNGNDIHINEISVAELTRRGGNFFHMPIADDFFAAIAGHANQQAKLLVDIKDAGFETEIWALINYYRLQNRVVYVSWLPEVIYAMHDLAPNADYCLSHWCRAPNAATRAVHRVFSARNGHIERPARHYVHGERSGWHVDGQLRGKMRDIVTAVCVPQNMANPEWAAAYQKDGIAVSTFSYVSWDHINKHAKSMNIDLYFIDNKTVFEKLS